MTGYPFLTLNTQDDCIWILHVLSKRNSKQDTYQYTGTVNDFLTVTHFSTIHVHVHAQCSRKHNFLYQYRYQYIFFWQATDFLIQIRINALHCSQTPGRNADYDLAQPRSQGLSLPPLLLLWGAGRERPWERGWI